MKIAVLGSGNGACAIAFEWSKAGHDVYMYDFPEYRSHISDINRFGMITSKGEMQGTQELAYAGHDIEKCLEFANLIFVVSTARRTELFGKACRPYILPGQKYIVCPASCMGSIVFKRSLGLDLSDNSIVVSDTSTLPYAVRITRPAEITVYNHLNGGYKLATLPSKCGDEVFELLKKVHVGITKATNVFETCLQNCNPVLHPCITTLNLARVEGAEDFLFYEQGITPGVGRMLKAIDEERIEIAEAYGANVLSEPELGLVQGYMTEASYDKGLSTAPGFKGILAPNSIDDRYYNEDAGVGLVFWEELANLAGLDVPNIKAMLQIVSTISGRDYRKEGARTLESLGLGGLDRESILNLL